MSVDVNGLWERTCAAAKVQGIDLELPANQYSVWHKDGTGRLIFCGGWPSIDQAYAWARQHIQLKSVYVFGPERQLVPLEDSDRAPYPTVPRNC